ncbi:MAG: sigma-54 dependent transcriptional regulator, partial [Desulfobulbaceae bacterium]|nr:sigma-54 dependent transcriptional regulator [Desulfobulbaceae bacterium]
METLKRIKDAHSYLPVIMISGHGNIETAVQATRLGAYDFIEKPPSYDKIVLSINNALRLSQLEKDNLILRQKTEGAPSLTGESEAICNLRQQIELVAPTDAWVLIRGEHGTGKELVAQSIHRHSKSSDRPMIELNCAAIPEELIESELFGHEKGAFTGATAAKRGKFDLANGGMLFLDEIGDMSMKTQAKILRILQEQKFERVGGSRTYSVDVRVLAATNKDLEKEIEDGNFRADLFYRLNVVPIFVPPLRERLDDIPLLAEDFLVDISRKGLGKKTLSEGALAVLSKHAWPGNVRELRNFMERVAIMNPADEISESMVLSLLQPCPVEKQTAGGDRDSFEESLSGGNFKEAKRVFEREFLLRRLRENDGNISQTAEQVGLERSHLHKKIKSFADDEDS